MAVVPTPRSGPALETVLAKAMNSIALQNSLGKATAAHIIVKKGDELLIDISSPISCEDGVTYLQGRTLPLSSWLTLGFNQNTGKAGLFPASCLELEALVVDYGSTAVRFNVPEGSTERIALLTRVGEGSVKSLIRWIFNMNDSEVSDLLLNKCWFDSNVFYSNTANISLFGAFYNDLKLVVDSLRHQGVSSHRQVVFPHSNLFTYHQKLLYRQAAVALGLERPVFVYQSHALISSVKEEMKNCMVISIGASFTEVTMYTVKPTLQCVSMHASALGGLNLTNALFKTASNAIQSIDGEKLLLFDLCEAAKITLLELGESSVTFRGIHERFTLQQFLASISETLTELTSIIKKCLDQSGIHSKDVDTVLLHGGSSFLFQYIDMLPQARICKLESTAILKGARALRDHAISINKFGYYYYGIQLKDGSFYPILHPRSESGSCLVKVTSNSFIIIPVYEGKYRSLESNSLIGVAKLDSLEFMKDQTLKLTLSINEQGYRVLNLRLGI
jgi:hypothetical protein